MLFGPVRFLHAANLWVDHPLSGTGPLSGGNRQTAEEATLTAFSHMVAAAIEYKVDFLLLAGNVFDDEDRSVRARVALRDGFGRLGQQQIRVFVTPGHADPPDAWRDVPHLPENVTILFPGDRDSVAVIRDGRVIASVAAGGIPDGHGLPGELSSTVETATQAAAPAGTARPDDNRQRGPFAVVVNSSASLSSEQLNSDSCDYIALGGDRRRQTISTAAGIAHHPGSTQGLSCAEAGPHGCTLVEVDSDRRIDTRFVLTAPVRWENPTVAVGRQTTREELQEQMEILFETIGPESAEALRLITWQVTGYGRLFDLLGEDDGLWLELVDALRRRFERDDQHPAVIHRFRLIPQLTPEAPNPDGSSAVGPEASDNRLAGEFTRMIVDECLLSPGALEDCLKTISGLDPAHTERLQSLLPNLDRTTIQATACRLGRRWFARVSEEEICHENG